jgi:anaerobic ribonucleoside-triphosphate reductase activating protein
MRIANVSTGFIEVPGQISLNIYAQGCKIGCKGCQNPELLSFDGGIECNNEVFSQIIKNKQMPTWICWLGGDATFQPDGFLSANQLFKEKGYHICLYTGQLFSEIQHLIKDVDMVVDGPWQGIEVKNTGTNQKVYLKQNNEWKMVTFSEIKRKTTLYDTSGMEPW